VSEQQKLTTLSDLIVAYLEQIGVEYVFGIPGGHVASLYESLYRSEQRGGIRTILNAHETGAAFMAAGYALETGKMGVCIATAGPGASNIVTGVAEAYAAHLPLLVITGQTALATAGRGALQECAPFQGGFPDIMDTISMMENCTSYNTLVTHPAQLEGKLAAALITAHQGLKAPVHLGIPADVLRAASPQQTLNFPNLANLVSRATHACVADMSAIAELWRLIHETLMQNRKVALFVGHECGDAGADIMQFAELINAPIVTSLRGKAKIDPYHPLCKGVFGMAGHQTARRALADESVCLILAVGTSLGQMGTSSWHPDLMNHKLVHIYHTNTYFPRSPMARLQVCGSAQMIFQELIARLQTTQQQGKLPDMAYQNLPQAIETGDIAAAQYLPPPQLELRFPESYQNVTSPIKPQRLMYVMMRQFPPETRFLIDNGTAVEWTVHYFFFKAFENYRLITTGPCSMGWAAGSAVGTALGNRGTPVVCLIGDGSYLMYGHEITVAVTEKLPVIFIILNDSGYGAVKHRNNQIGTEKMEFAMCVTDFVMMAKSVGASGYTIRDAGDFDKLDFQAICESSGPTVLDVYIDPNEAPPIGA
jgi:acetolactate synthase I/II/III large subunit